jgi:LysR family transcriptional regulator, glycine cleavage system transcriptional activator
MSRRLPPLNALRAFEAAARHLSVSRAAAELHVTPAAISHQVKALEEWLGVPLFRRLNRQILLTDAGQISLKGLRDGFDRLALTVETVSRQSSEGPLTVSAAQSFAGKWLVPRLERFRRAHPEIDVRIDANPNLTDFKRDNIDIAIRYGRGRYPGLRVDRLMAERVFPLCSPRLRRGPPPLRHPRDLARYTLLHIDMPFMLEAAPSWEMWLRAAGVSGVDWTRGPRFSVSSMAIETAMAGQGVVLGSDVLCAADLSAGRLVKPFDVGLALDFGYWIVSPEGAAERPKAVAFRNWLVAEARAHEAGEDDSASGTAAPRMPGSRRRSQRTVPVGRPAKS